MQLAKQCARFRALPRCFTHQCTAARTCNATSLPIKVGAERLACARESLLLRCLSDVQVQVNPAQARHRQHPALLAKRLDSLARPCGRLPRTSASAHSVLPPGRSTASSCSTWRPPASPHQARHLCTWSVALAGVQPASAARRHRACRAALEPRSAADSLDGDNRWAAYAMQTRFCSKEGAQQCAMGLCARYTPRRVTCAGAVRALSATGAPPSGPSAKTTRMGSPWKRASSPGNRTGLSAPCAHISIRSPALAAQGGARSICSDFCWPARKAAHSGASQC